MEFKVIDSRDFEGFLYSPELFNVFLGDNKVQLIVDFDTKVIGNREVKSDKFSLMASGCSDKPVIIRGEGCVELFRIIRLVHEHGMYFFNTVSDIEKLCESYELHINENVINKGMDYNEEYAEFRKDYSKLITPYTIKVMTHDLRILTGTILDEICLVEGYEQAQYFVNESDSNIIDSEDTSIFTGAKKFFSLANEGDYYSFSMIEETDCVHVNYELKFEDYKKIFARQTFGTLYKQFKDTKYGENVDISHLEGTDFNVASLYLHYNFIYSLFDETGMTFSSIAHKTLKKMTDTRDKTRTNEVVYTKYQKKQIAEAKTTKGAEGMLKRFAYQNDFPRLYTNCRGGKLVPVPTGDIQSQVLSEWGYKGGENGCNPRYSGRDLNINEERAKFGLPPIDHAVRIDANSMYASQMRAGLPCGHPRRYEMPRKKLNEDRIYQFALSITGMIPKDDTVEFGHLKAGFGNRDLFNCTSVTSRILSNMDSNGDFIGRWYFGNKKNANMFSDKKFNRQLEVVLWDIELREILEKFDLVYCELEFDDYIGMNVPKTEFVDGKPRPVLHTISTYEDFEKCMKDVVETTLEFNIIYDPFEEFIEKYYNEKKETGSLFSKLCLNGCIGKFGTKNKGDFRIYEENNGKLVFSMTDSKIRLIDTNYLPMSSYVNASARVDLSRTRRLIGEKYCIFCDTDSIATILSEDEIKMLVGNKLGVELGQWKIDDKYDRCKHIVQKRYITSLGDDYSITIAGVKDIDIDTKFYDESLSVDDVYNQFNEFGTIKITQKVRVKGGYMDTVSEIPLVNRIY